MIDNIMNEIDNMSDEELAEMRKENEEDVEFANFITMSLYLPPEALMTLVDSGLLPEDQIKEIIDMLSQGKTSSNEKDDIPFGWFPPSMGDVDINDLFGGSEFPPIGYKKFNFKDNSNPENRDADDYGSHWKDWSPYPDDYLDDRG
jgi:hypothetical protein